MNSKLTCRAFAAISLAGSLLLTACGGSQEPSARSAPQEPTPRVVSPSQGDDLPNGVSAAAMQPGYGQPQSPADTEKMAQRLRPQFNGRSAQDPESLMGEVKRTAVPKAAPSPQVVYRFFNTLTGVHFYTISAQERDRVLAELPQFSLDGPAFFSLRADSAGLSPVYRFYNRVSGTHFYTISAAERDDVVARFPDIFQLEGVAWYASTASGTGWVPMHRFFNTRTGTHFYTASEQERANVVASLPDYVYEGIGYFIRGSGDPFLSGTVAVNGLVRNAVVCLDLDDSGTCDPGEPASARTGANGIYALSFARSAVSEAEQLAASLIARMVPGDPANASTTIDQGTGAPVTTTAYVLRQVPGEAGQISPLSTLVSAGVAAGMDEATARRNAALQLAIPEAKIDQYQDDPALNQVAPVDSARLMAYVVARALEEGVPLVLAEQNSPVDAALADLRTLRYTDANNYSYLEFSILAKAQGTPGLSLSDSRQGRNGGAVIGEDDLYNQAYLAPDGWTGCRSDILLTGMLGTPSRSTFCDVLQTVSYRSSVSVAGRSMTSVVTELQADPGNPINAGLSTSGLLTALGSASFPSGSALRPGYTLNLNQPVFINSVNTDGRFEGVDATLEVLRQDYQAADANAALPGPGFTLSLGLGSGSFRNLRVAFVGAGGATSGPVQFYECDLDSSLTVASNCAATQTGTYAITTIHGARVMSFAGHAPTVMNHERLYVEVRDANRANGFISGDWVFLARRLKPGFTHNAVVNTRLNGTGWGAMKAQLGI
jgi:hypothetical protein